MDAFENFGTLGIVILLLVVLAIVFMCQLYLQNRFNLKQMIKGGIGGKNKIGGTGQKASKPSSDDDDVTDIKLMIRCSCGDVIDLDSMSCSTCAKVYSDSDLMDLIRSSRSQPGTVGGEEGSSSDCKR